MQTITYGSVCSGIEAATVAWHPIGWKPSWFAEIEAFPSAVLAHHYPDVPNLGDMTTIAARIATGEVTAPDVLVGGTPCQAFSVAGMRGGLSDVRGQLTISFVGLADEIDRTRAAAGAEPCTIVWENVPGVLSSKDNAFGCFLGALAGEADALQPPGGKWANAGYVCGPQRTIAWRILDAQYFGVAQRRRRVFVVASAGNRFDPAEILFEFHGLRRDTAPSREAGQGAAADVAPSLVSSGRGVERIGETRGQDPVVAVAFDSRQDPVSSEHVFGALSTSSPQAQAVAFGIPGNWIGRRPENGGNAVEPMHNLAPCLTGADRHGVCVTGDVHPTLESTNPKQFAQVDMAVRRLTPVECERLQAFPDNYTLIPVRSKPAADGPRYKALGNSMCVNVMHWIGKRLDAVMRVTRCI